MKLSQFKYDLPQDLIALHPVEERDESRLLVVDRKTGNIEHKLFKDVINYFEEGDVFVLNNTRVFPALLYGEKEKTGASISVVLLRELDEESRLWDVLVDPARKIRIGNKLYFGEENNLVAEVIDNTTSRGRTLRFLFDGTHDEFIAKLKEIGNTPLPDELKNIRDIVPGDLDNYQTIYAKEEGAVAAPTAGLHFSRELLKMLEIKGINFAEITLHVGLGNFRQIDVEDLTKYKTDSEDYSIDTKACKIINSAIDDNKKIVAVGTTTAKALESSVYMSGKVKPENGWTNKFIFPPYEFMVPDAMITNFHQSQSPMMMLASAFTGYELLLHVYNEAIKEKYRFLTYGDAMLVL